MTEQEKLTKLDEEIEQTTSHIRLLKERLKDPHEVGKIKKWVVYLEGLLDSKRLLEEILEPVINWKKEGNVYWRVSSDRKIEIDTETKILDIDKALFDMIGEAEDYGDYFD